MALRGSQGHRVGQETHIHEIEQSKIENNYIITAETTELTLRGSLSMFLERQRSGWAQLVPEALRPNSKLTSTRKPSPQSVISPLCVPVALILICTSGMVLSLCHLFL